MNKKSQKRLMIGLIIGIILISIFSLFLISSQGTNTNKKSEVIINQNTSKYGKIEINDSSNDKLATLELKRNTDYCLSTCSANLEIIMYQKGILIDEVKFMEKQLDNKFTEKSIAEYKFYIKNGTKEIVIDDYETKCIEKETLNKTKYDDCFKIKNGNHSEYEDTYKKYILGTEVKAGTYYVKLEGEKDYDKTIDWQITSQGKLIDEWAEWSESLEVNLISYWEMEDSSGGIVDSHGENDGVENGNPTYSQTGIIEDAIEFDGTGDYFEVGDTPFDITNKLSISIWIKPDNFDHNQMPISKSYLAYEILIKATSVHFYLSGNELYGTFSLSTAAWNHIVVTYDENGGDDNKIIYIDGSKLISETQAGAIATNAYDLTFGKRPTQANYDYDGFIDEVGVWDRILSPAEVSDLYNGGDGISYGIAVPENCWTSTSWGIYIPDGCIYQINSGEVG